MDDSVRTVCDLKRGTQLLQASIWEFTKNIDTPTPPFNRFKNNVALPIAPPYLAPRNIPTARVPHFKHRSGLRFRCHEIVLYVDIGAVHAKDTVANARVYGPRQRDVLLNGAATLEDNGRENNAMSG